LSAIARIGKRYTLVIPKDIRKRIGIHEGSYVLLRVMGDKIIVEPLPDEPFKVLGRVIGKPYDEKVDEKKALEWLMKNARS